MIHSVTVTNYLGDSIELELKRPEKSGFYIKSIDGLGPGKSDINVTDISTGDGGLFNSARLQPRNIVLTLGFLMKQTIEDVRQSSYKYFPIKRGVNLRIETDNRTLEIDGYVESNEPNIFSENEDTDISIICPNPYFYSSGDGNTTVFSGIEPMFKFPFSNESLTEKLIMMGSIENKSEQNIIYEGDVEIGITITIHAVGSASGITIYNINTREQMSINSTKLEQLTGSDIVNGDDIIISTVQGSKSITLTREGATTNILNCLDKNSDWFVLSKGDNIFAYTAEEGAQNLQFKVENKIAYEGV